jgi:methylmalonyl-CoA mutase N-terminal domain/subunit
MLRFHTQVAGVSLTAQQPLNNIARVTIQALAAVCGGTQSLHTNSYDEALGLPTEESATVALRTQQIIAEESGAANVVDPLGGSYLVEELTDAIYSQAMDKILEIEKLGGAMAAIEAGHQQREIHESAWSHQSKVESGDRLIVGVNHGLLEEEGMPPLLKPDPSLGERQKTKLTNIRSNRNNEAAMAALEVISNGAKTSENLFPLVMDALKADCTLGEIMNAMKDVFGTWMAPSGV